MEKDLEKVDLEKVDLEKVEATTSNPLVSNEVVVKIEVSQPRRDSSPVVSTQPRRRSSVQLSEEARAAANLAAIEMTTTPPAFVMGNKRLSTNRLSGVGGQVHRPSLVTSAGPNYESSPTLSVSPQNGPGSSHSSTSQRRLSATVGLDGKIVPVSQTNSQGRRKSSSYSTNRIKKKTPILSHDSLLLNIWNWIMVS